MSTPDEALSFWLDEVGPSGWYAVDEALDSRVIDLFRDTWDRGAEGGLSLWLTYPSGTLAYLLVTDQFPRNMFRGDPRSFQLDPFALAAAKIAISRGWDMRIDPPARQFFYLPLMHSENASDQDRCVRLFCDRMPDAENNLLHARAHRAVIREFGRFPHRNDVMGRTTTTKERAFLEGGGYGATVRRLQDAA